MSLELRAELSYKAASGVVLNAPGLPLYMSRKSSGEQPKSSRLKAES